MQGPSTIIKSSVAALMLHSADGPLSQLPIHQHLGRLALLNPSAVLSKQMHDPMRRTVDRESVFKRAVKGTEGPFYSDVCHLFILFIVVQTFAEWCTHFQRELIEVGDDDPVEDFTAGQGNRGQ